MYKRQGSLGSSAEDDARCLLTVLAYLATRPEVAYLDELPPVFELNVEAAWITQSGEETTYSTWSQGIDGRTEVRGGGVGGGGCGGGGGGCVAAADAAAAAAVRSDVSSIVFQPKFSAKFAARTLDRRTFLFGPMR